MDKHENPVTKVERINPSDAQTAHPFSPAGLQVGADEMRRMMPTAAIDDGFKLVDEHTKHTADGFPSAPGQGGDHLKHTADGVPSAPGQGEGHLLRTSETPNKGSDDRADSSSWMANQYKPGEDLGKWAANENRDYVANLFKTAAPSDASRPSVQPAPYAPDNGDPVKEHRSLPNKFVHSWSHAPVGNEDSPRTPKPIVLRGQNEDLTGGKNKSHSWF